MISPSDLAARSRDSSNYAPNCAEYMTGVFIAGMGLPGSGKSAVFSALADLLIRDGIKTTLYREPEEAEWPPAVTERRRCGAITALTWFRAQRVPFCYKAVADRAADRVAL